MAVRPIDANELYRIEKLLDTDIVRQDKVALNLLEQVLYDIQHVPTLTPPNEPSLLEFDVVDTTTGKYPDWERIAREESWAKGLVYCDMDGIAIREDGSLILLDECGNCVSCPPDRFEIRRCPPEGEVNA
ncbi:hypothetical protein [Anaeromassilibacillus sp. An250]|uniref:hypothetical protein n=1 Tax=Anaeromassilibacillus sp. An250 TaxID=1965604 RepID=UPI000B3793A1|nr:hypothetical protein [Anaeromassilibacillus sp. An250]OUO75511.1 hypothetical protein B5F54_04325 [Anaeromassilibacillus sp. An250]